MSSTKKKTFRQMVIDAIAKNRLNKLTHQFADDPIIRKKLEDFTRRYEDTAKAVDEFCKKHGC